MAYGYQQCDENGDEVFNSTVPVLSLIKIDEITITLYKDSSFGATTYDYSLPGVSSQADLDDNYIVQQVSNEGFSFLIDNSAFSVTYVSTGLIRFNGAGGCTTIFGAPGPCTSLDYQTKTYKIYTMGQTL
jgi:hypothetical protein